LTLAPFFAIILNVNINELKKPVKNSALLRNVNRNLPTSNTEDATKNTRDFISQGGDIRIQTIRESGERLYHELGIPRPTLSALLKKFGLTDFDINIAFNQNRSGFVAYQSKDKIDTVDQADFILAFSTSPKGQTKITLSGSIEGVNLKAQYQKDGQEFRLRAFDAKKEKVPFLAKIKKWSGEAVPVPTQISLKPSHSM